MAISRIPLTALDNATRELLRGENQPDSVYRELVSRGVPSIWIALFHNNDAVNYHAEILARLETLWLEEQENGIGATVAVYTENESILTAMCYGNNELLRSRASRNPACPEEARVYAFLMDGEPKRIYPA